MKRIFALIFALLLSGCETGLQQMGTTEFGVLFRMLPPMLGGGLSGQLVDRGEMVVVWPWDKIYRFDTKVQSIDWGAVGEGTDGEADYVQTRALDGNEVALAVKIEYRITDEPQKLVRLAREIAVSHQQVQDIVTAVARADIRTEMNRLTTAEFFSNKSKYEGERRVRDSMRERLKQFGIEVLTVNLKEHRFERLLPDGSVDRTYQERINEVQTTIEETNRERLRVGAVGEDKQRMLNEATAKANRMVEEANGYKKQAVLRADAYYAARGNEATGILARGEADVEGIKKGIEALSGPGGKAILKLELAKQLLKNNPRFLVLGEDTKGQGIEVRKLDTNQLIEQIGILEGLKDRIKSSSVQSLELSSPQSAQASGAAEAAPSPRLPKTPRNHHLPE